MRFPEALYYALKIRSKHPEYKLCGSVALILSGRMPVRDVHDIDFIARKSDVNTKKLRVSCNYPPRKNKGFLCYEVNESMVFRYNVFVFEDDEPIDTKEVNLKIQMQNPEDIIKWKKKFNRPKDKLDIKAIKEYRK